MRATELTFKWALVEQSVEETGRRARSALSSNCEQYSGNKQSIQFPICVTIISCNKWNLFPTHV